MTGWMRGRSRQVRDVLVGVEGVVASHQHAPGETTHRWLRLKVQVAKHGVGLPPSQQAYGVGIDVRVEQCHSATRAEGAGTDIGREVAILWAHNTGCVSESGGHIGGVDHLVPLLFKV